MVSDRTIKQIEALQELTDAVLHELEKDVEELHRLGEEIEDEEITL